MPRNRYHEGRRATISTASASSILAGHRPGPTAMLRWKLAGGAATWPKSILITAAKPEPRVARLRVTMIGHASLLIQAAGMDILTDPVWSERASPFAFAGPGRVTSPAIAFDHPPIGAITGDGASGLGGSHAGCCGFKGRCGCTGKRQRALET